MAHAVLSKSPVILLLDNRSFLSNLRARRAKSAFFETPHLSVHLRSSIMSPTPVWL